MLVTIDAEVLAHAINVHVDPAIVLKTSDIDRQAWVALVYCGVDTGGFFEHVGCVAGGALVDLLAGNHGHPFRRLVHPIRRITLTGRHRGSAQGQGAVVFAADAGQGDLALAGKAILHRVVAQQARQAFLYAKVAIQRYGVQAAQHLAVKQHLQAGLLGKYQYGLVQRLGRDMEGNKFLLNGAADLICGLHRHLRRQQGDNPDMNCKG